MLKIRIHSDSDHLSKKVEHLNMAENHKTTPPELEELLREWIILRAKVQCLERSGDPVSPRSRVKLQEYSEAAATAAERIFAIFDETDGKKT